MLAAVLVSGCGTRTSLLVPDQSAEGEGEGDSGVSMQDGSDASTSADAPEIDFDAGIHCSLHSGPVASCDAGAAAGPVQLCNAHFSECIRVFEPGGNVPYGQFGCCLANPPERVNQCMGWQSVDGGCM
jgi:hypothetical protein